MLMNSHSGVVTHNPFAAPALEGVISLTPSQLEILATAGECDLASCAYNTTIRICIRGELDTVAVSEAACMLSRRHQSLRATFHMASRTMCVARELPPRVHLDEISVPENGAASGTLAELAREEACEPFDLENGPLMRFRVVRTGKTTFVIFMVTHQLAVDHWSVDLLAHEFAELYSSVVESRQSALLPVFSYMDYARWLREPTMVERRAENHEYWLEKLSKSVELVEIIGDKEASSVRGYAATRSEREIPDALVAAAAAAAAAEKSTFFAYTLSCYFALICRLGGSGYVRVGIPAAGQLDVGENRLAGSCINMLPITVQVDVGMTFRDCLQAVRKELYAAQSYTPFTYSEVLAELGQSRAAGRLPLLTTTFNVDQENHVLAFSGLEASYSFEPRCADKFELAMNVVSFGDHASVQCHGNDDVFSVADRDSLLDAWIAALGFFVQDPDARIADATIEPGSLRRAGIADRSAETPLVDRFPVEHMSSAHGADNVIIPSAAYAHRQAEAVAEEFGLQLPAAPPVPECAVTAAPRLAEASTGRSQQEQSSFYFGPGEQLYGIYYPAARSPANNRAVLLCGPHGDEAVRSHRLIRSLAKELQTQGIPSLRFDYFGQGDSAGNDVDASLAIWRDNIAAAREELARRSGCRSIVGVGLRIGANLLLDLGAGGAFESLILVDAIRNGQAELDAWRKKNRWMLRDVGKFRFGRFRLYRKAGIEELAGFCYGPQMLRQMAAISIDGTPLPDRLGVRAIGLGGTDWSASLKIPFESAGDSPEWNNALFMQKPIVNRALVNLICARVRAGE